MNMISGNSCRKLIYILYILFISPCVFGNEVNDLYLNASVKKMCNLNIPETIQFKDISSGQLIGNVSGLDVGKPESLEIIVDCGLSPSNLISLELVPNVGDDGCLGINEDIKIIRLCFEYLDEKVELNEEGITIPLNTNLEDDDNSKFVMKFTVKPQTGKDQLNEKIDGSYTAFLNVRLNFE